MSNYIKQVKVNLWEGVFKKDIDFNDKLNLLSGSNGTGKTQVLNFIYDNKDNANVVYFDGSEKNITCFSPKRNAEKQLVEQIQIQAGLTKTQRKQLIRNIQQGVNDANLQTINSIAFYLQNEAQLLVDTKGKTRDEATELVKTEYQNIFSKLFGYKLIFNWNSETAQPQAKILKNDKELTLNQLSAGENALLSLVCAIYFSKDDSDIYLIDEPEVHLNWSLEERLFIFLDEFCEKYNKQIISVTHSRIIALDQFRTKSKFLSWNGDKISVNEDFTPDMITNIAGDTVKIIQGITSKQKLIYVEDKAHKVVIDEIGKALNLDISAQIVTGGCEFVKSFSKAFKNIPVYNVFFLIDSDNKPLTDTEKNEYKNLIQLEKYCIENYLLNVEILNLYETADWDEKLKQLINSIDVKAKPAIKPVQVALGKSATVAELIDYLDGSEVFSGLANEKKGDKKKKYELMSEIIQKIPKEDLLEKYFTELKFLSK